MKKPQLKKTLGLAALCAVALVGLKDTGILLSDHTTTLNSGKTLSFAAEEEVNIIGEKEGIFTVKKGDAQVSIPKNKLIKTEVSEKIFITKKNTPIKSNGKVLRNLFLGEQVTLTQDRNDGYVVKTKDGLNGLVSKDALEAAGMNSYITKGTSKVNKTLKNNNKTLVVKKNQEISIVSFEKGNFVLINESGDAFYLPMADVQLDGKDIAPASPAPAKPVAKAVLPEAKEEVAPADGSKSSRVLASLTNKLGSTYVYGDTGSAGYDCSGLVYAIYKNELNINVPRTSSAQSQFGKQVSKDQLQRGDLVFFATTGTGNVSHVGVYIGNDEFIHAASGQGKVVKNKLTEKYYTQNFVNATRVL